MGVTDHLGQRQGPAAQLVQGSPANAEPGAELIAQPKSVEGILNIGHSKMKRDSPEIRGIGVQRLLGLGASSAEHLCSESSCCNGN